MQFINGNIFSSDCSFRRGSFGIENGRFINVHFEDNIIEDHDQIECQDRYIIPGLVDIHFHGCVGHDFCDASQESFDAISQYQLKHGITAICPATMTYPEDKLDKVMKLASNYSNVDGADLVGINLEGPFISKDKVGAQNPKYVQKPNYEMIKRLQNSANGLIKLIDIAPEVDGALDFIKNAKNDFKISIAHTCSDYATAKQAYKLGASHLTHAFNAMPPIHHRNPGPIPAASEAGAYAEIICDGMHIDYSVVRLAFEIFGEDKLCLISDSCEATGLDDGQYSLGGQDIIKTGTKVVLKNDQNTIAASATNLFDCMKHAIKDANISPEFAIRAATINPSSAIGIDDLYGSIANNKYANFNIVDSDFNLLETYRHGKKI